MPGRLEEGIEYEKKMAEKKRLKKERNSRNENLLSTQSAVNKVNISGRSGYAETDTKDHIAEGKRR